MGVTVTIGAALFTFGTRATEVSAAETVAQLTALVLAPTAATFAVLRLKSVRSRWFAVLVVGPLCFLGTLFVALTVAMRLGWIRP